MDVYEGWFRIQKRDVKSIIQSLLADERHVLVLGQTGSGKTCLTKALVGAWLLTGAGACVLDFNDEYPQSLAVERAVRPAAFPLFLSLTDPTLPQELLATVAMSDGLEQLLSSVADELYDSRVVKALRLRWAAFNTLQSIRYTLPIAKVDRYRMAIALAILADRLLDNVRELLVVEEAQYFEKRALSFLAAEGRKRGKKCIFITNDITRISPTVFRNSIIVAFRLLPRDWWELGITRPISLRKYEFVVVDPSEEKLRKYRLKTPWG